MPIGNSDVSFSTIQSEYGGSNPISLSEYYRTVGNVGEVTVPNAPANGTVTSGGVTYVVSNSTNGIPTSGTISANNFRNTAKAVTILATITTDKTDFNLLASIYSVLGSFYAPIVCTCTINSGVRVYATSTANAGFTTGAGWYPGSLFSLVNNGSIIGRGGDGANGYYGNGWNTGNPGGNAGTALNITLNTTITNGSGNIWGGGGGGGASGTAGTAYVYYNNVGQAGGGGGAGNGAGGTNSSLYWYYLPTWVQGSNGTAGSLSAAGSGGTTNYVSQFNPGGKGDPGETVYMYSGAGGAGGNFGAAGSTGATGSYTGIVGANHTPGPGISGGGAGGAAGKAINLNGYLATFISGNNGSQVRGAVS